MRLIVLQARLPDDPMRAHEQRCFLRASDLAREVFDFRNIPDAVPSLDEVRGYDALLVGGSAHYSVVDSPDPFIHQTRELLLAVADLGFPCLASCFGYQLLAAALGGQVIHDESNGEVGSYWVELTAAARDDELFSRLPAGFYGQMGHLDRVDRQPPGIPNLAGSARAPHQALRIPGKPIWATQFHPELDEVTNCERYLSYLERYDPDGTRGADIEQRFKPSPHPTGLLRAFLERLDR